MQHLLDLLVLRRQHILNDGHEKRGLSTVSSSHLSVDLHEPVRSMFPQ
jgi:hypothetical protein